MFIEDPPYGKKRVADVKFGGNNELGWSNFSTKLVDKTPEELEIDRLKERIYNFLALDYDEINLEQLRIMVNYVPSNTPKRKTVMDYMK